MPLLALNTVLPQSMRVKYQLGIAALPISLMVASFFPLWWFAHWLEVYYGIPANSPINEHPNGVVWIAVFLIAMVSLMVLGCAIGWVLNAVIARYFFNWSTEKVQAVYLHSNVPAHWLKEGTAAESGRDTQGIAKWEAQRKVGALRFILRRGVLAWGGPMLLAMHLIPTLVKGQRLSIETTLFQVAFWACAGAGFGIIIWYSSEANYRKMKQRDEA